jgi:hypothetical protein
MGTAGDRSRRPILDRVGHCLLRAYTSLGCGSSAVPDFSWSNARIRATLDGGHVPPTSLNISSLAAAEQSHLGHAAEAEGPIFHPTQTEPSIGRLPSRGHPPGAFGVFAPNPGSLVLSSRFMVIRMSTVPSIAFPSPI